MSSAPLWSTFASVVGTLLGLAVEVGLLIIALTMVKPRRPDAAMPFVIGAVIQIAATILWPAFTTFIIPFVGSGGDVPISAVYAVFGLFMTLVRTAAWAAILFGIVKLATPPGGPPRDPTRFGG